jgi:hypothetical protein
MMTPRILWAALFASTFIYVGIFSVHGAENNGGWCGRQSAPDAGVS